MIRVISIRKLEELLEDLGGYGDPVVICVENGETTIRMPWSRTAREYADLVMRCDEAWIGVRIW